MFLSTVKYFPLCAPSCVSYSNLLRTLIPPPHDSMFKLHLYYMTPSEPFHRSLTKSCVRMLSELTWNCACENIEMEVFCCYTVIYKRATRVGAMVNNIKLFTYKLTQRNRTLPKGIQHVRFILVLCFLHPEKQSL